MPLNLGKNPLMASCINLKHSLLRHRAPRRCCLLDRTRHACAHRYRQHSTLYGKRLEPDELRLLRLVPNQEHGAGVEGILTRHSRQDHMRYKALSYTWGNPHSRARQLEDRVVGISDPYDQKHLNNEVLINGIVHSVSLNLIQALRQFRNSGKLNALWVDAICINQEDKTEITQQVQQMGQIYRNADEVLIWLGEIESRHEAREAVELLEDIVSIFEKWYNLNHQTKFQDEWERISKRVENIPDCGDQKEFWDWLKEKKAKKWLARVDMKKALQRQDGASWMALNKLLCRNWFDRVWTWQEKELAKAAQVYIGDIPISWRRLRFAMLIVMAYDRSKPRVRGALLMPSREYLRVVDSHDIDGTPDLLDIVMNVRHRTCYDARDKIYGVLGGADTGNSSHDAEIFIGEIDYKQRDTPIKDLYQRFASYYIHEKKDLRVLQACNAQIIRPVDSPLKTLPSWVADWTDTTPSHQLSDLIYDASKETLVDSEYSKTDGEISLRGITVDKVSIVCQDDRIDELETKLDESAEWFDWREELIATYASLYVCGIESPAHQNLLRDSWLKVSTVIDWNGIYQPTAESFREAYWRCLMLDKAPASKMDSQRQINSNISLCNKFHDIAYNRALAQNSPNDAIGQENLNQQAKAWVDALQRSILRKRFFVTKRGLIGMAPPNLAAGDQLVVFYGGRVPFLVRSVGEHYEFVEETYVHGYMYGRAIDEERAGLLESKIFKLR